MMPTTLARLRRSLRFHPAAERLVSTIKSGRTIHLPELDLRIDVDPGDLVLDCGANVGDITSRFARCGALVHAFEPNPRAFKVLERRFAGMANVHCHMAGVMDEDCELTLSIPLAHERWDDLEATVSGSMMASARPAVDHETVRVPCVGLPAFVRGLGRRVRLAKIDIEGAEIAVINGLIDSGAIGLIDHVVVETHERQMPELAADTEALRSRIALEGLGEKIRLDWI